jgi:murein DD-endopeptidase MepM/ murein hydrolase activator NlpD
MKHLQGMFCALLAQQSGQMQFFLIAPILTLSFLSLIVRTANSALDPALEKRKVTEQLKQRLNEVQNHEEILSALVPEAPPRPQKKGESSVGTLRETPSTALVWRAVGGRIGRSFYDAAIRAGVPARIIDNFVDMDWDLDFSSDLRPTDTFKIIFEEFRRDGKILEYGQILAAEIANKGKTFTLFSLARAYGRDEAFHITSRPFLRYPLQFTRISSVFTDARMHPILQRVRPHHGVDFAAPLGTPVRAVAGGKAIYTGWNGSFGNLVRIDHPGPYDSLYAHLQRVAKGLKIGVAVKRGQVIGYVGATGLATGPHLHFALFRDGKYINPLTTKLPVEEADTQQPQSVEVAEMKRHLTEQLAALKVEHTAVSLVLPASQNISAVSRKTSEPGGQRHLALTNPHGARTNHPRYWRNSEG